MDFNLPINEQMTYVFQAEYGTYTILAAFLFGFILSFAVGANDSANSWGTPVGAKTVTLGIAFLLGSICESAGSIFLSKNVIDGVSGDTSIVRMSMYRSDNATEVQLFEEEKFDKLYIKERALMLGLVTSMVASQMWQLAATWLGWPVSGTHTIISALLGFTLVENGPSGVNVGNPSLLESSGIFKVIYGLVLAPLMGLVLGFIVYYPIYKYAVTASNQNSWICKIIYSLCVFVIFMAITFFFVVLQAIPPSGFSRITYGLVIGTAVGLVFALSFVLVHKKLLSMTGDFQFSLDIIQKSIDKVRQKPDYDVEPTTQELNQSSEFGSTPDSSTIEHEPETISHTTSKQIESDSPKSVKSISYENISSTNIDEEPGVVSLNTDNTSIVNGYGALAINTSGDNSSGSKLFGKEDNAPVQESAEVKRVFQPLQLLCACYAAINHGSNDVANCIGPLVTAWMIYKAPYHCAETEDKLIILVWGALGICFGFVLYGKKVIETMGTKICNITPSMGFSVVLTASILVMMASITGLPASTTHCQVMGIVGASIAKGWIDSGSIQTGLRSFDSGLIMNIALSWIVTIPCAIAMSACVYAPVRALIIGPF